MNLYLVIDTATNDSSVSLLFNSSTLIKKSLGTREQTKELIPKIKDLLKENNLELNDLTGIAVCIGPGLFTGTRIGVMSAKTLSYATEIPIYPFSTFDLFKEKEPYALLDAKCSRAHLLHNNNIKLLNHSDLNKIKETIFTLDPAPFKNLPLSLKTTTKNIKGLYPLLERQKPMYHHEIEVYYPKEIK